MDESVDRSLGEYPGDERALEQLALVTVRDVMRSPAVVFTGAEHVSLLDAAGRRRFIYIVERDGRLVGRVETRLVSASRTLDEIMADSETIDAPVSPDTTLRDALLLMIDRGADALAVVDRDDRLVGELTLSAIKDVSARLQDD